MSVVVFLAMRPPWLSLYVAGTPSPAIAGAHGLYPAWFGRLAAAAGVELRAFDATSGYLPPDWQHAAAVVITGSPASLTAPEPWMEAGVELIREAYARRVPVLGVCFGHQLIGAAFGASVIPSPTGWEVGTLPIELSDAGAADPLFVGLPPRFEVNLSHRDTLDPDTLSPRNGIVVLARNARCAVQAVAAGPAIRGVQFHPELDAALTRAHVDARAGELDPGPGDLPALGRAADAPDGVKVFNNFLQQFAGIT